MADAIGAAGGVPQGGRRILIPVDSSEASDRVCDWAIKNFYRAGDALTLMTVIPTGEYVVVSSDVGMETVLQDNPESQEAVARTMMKDRFSAKLEAAGVPFQLEVARFRTDTDSIGSVICHRADQLGAAAIVIAKHTRGMLQTAVTEFFIGSVTSYLTHHSRAPVMVLHCD